MDQLLEDTSNGSEQRGKQEGEGLRQHEDECRSGEPHGKLDNEEAIACVEKPKKSFEAKMALRQINLKPGRRDPTFLSSLDFSIKCNSAVIKKLKQISEEQLEGLMDELQSVNLTRFVTEAVTAICDAKLKTSDIQAAVQICSLLHQRCEDFSSSLTRGLLKVFFTGKPAGDLEPDKNSKAMRKRITLELLFELYFVGVIEDSSIFVNIIEDLMGMEHLKDRDATQTNLSCLVTFARQGRVFLGLPLPEPEFSEEIFKGLSITAHQKKIIKKAFHTYYDAVADALQAQHTSFRRMEHENAKILNAKGELSDENASAYEKLRNSYDLLHRGVSSLAEALDMQPPVPEGRHTSRVLRGDDSACACACTSAGNESSAVQAVWDDERTRAFCECLPMPDLRGFVFAAGSGEIEPQASKQCANTQDKLAEKERVLSAPEVEAFANKLSKSVVQISLKSDDPNDKTTYGNGFVVYSGNFDHVLDSGNLNLGSTILRGQTYTLVMTAAHLFYNINQNIMSVKFFQEKQGHAAKVFHVANGYDLAILYIKDECTRVCLSFGDEKHIYQGTKIHCISQPQIGLLVQPHMLTSGYVCGYCESKPATFLADDCICVTVYVGAILSCSGSPIMDHKGKVLAVLSGLVGSFAIGIEVRSIKKFLKDCFGLKMDMNEFCVNDVFRHSESQKNTLA